MMPKWRKAVLAAAVVIAALVTIAGALYLRYLRIPEGYVDPDTLPHETVEARAREFTALAAQLASLRSDEAFNIAVPEEAVNAYIATTLARTGAAWYKEWRIPENVEHLQVRFRPKTIVLLGRLNRGWASCILSADLTPTLTTEGDLSVRVGEGRGGRLALPAALLGRFLQRLPDRTLSIRVGRGRRGRLTEVSVENGQIRLIGVPTGGS